MRAVGWFVWGSTKWGKGEDMSRKCKRIDVGRGVEQGRRQMEIQKSERDVYALVFILTRIGIPDRELTKESEMLLFVVARFGAVGASKRRAASESGGGESTNEPSSASAQTSYPFASVELAVRAATIHRRHALGKLSFPSSLDISFHFLIHFMYRVLADRWARKRYFG
jgi:hypothetical protein